MKKYIVMYLNNGDFGFYSVDENFCFFADKTSIANLKRHPRAKIFEVKTFKEMDKILSELLSITDFDLYALEIE